MRGSVSLSLIAVMTLTAARPSAAAPGGMPRVHVVAPAAVERMRSAAPMHFRSVQPTSVLRSSPPPPVVELPPLTPSRFNVLPLLQPLEAGALTSAGFADCGRTRPGVLVAMLPVAPFAPLSCGRSGAVDEGDRETSLVPGRNKNALYGRAYSLHDLDAP